VEQPPASPLYVPSLNWLRPALPLPVAPILGVLLLGLRYRRSRATGQNLRLPLLMVSLFVMLPIANGLVQFGLLDRDTFVALFLIVFSLVMASLAIGLMRYRLFDVELVVRRSLVYGIAWAAIVADDETMRAVGRPAGLNEWEAWDDLSRLAGHWALRGFGQWALEERESGELVGRAGLICPADWPDLEVGWLVRSDRRGRGYATEAGAAAMRWAFEELGADHLVSLIAEDNAASSPTQP